MQSILLSGPTTGFVFREMLETLFRMWGRLCLMVIVILGIGITLAVLSHPKYHASSSMLVLPGPEYTVRTVAGTNQSVNQSIDRTYILATEVAILQSRDLHRQVLQDIGLDKVFPDYLKPPGVVARLMKQLRELPGELIAKAQGLPPPPASAGPTLDPMELALDEFQIDFSAMASSESNTITVGFDHRDPEIAAKVLSTLEKLYLQRRLALFTDTQSTEVEQEVQQMRARLEAAERELAGFKVEHDISNFPARQDILLQQQGGAEKDLMEAQSDKDQQEARVKQLQVLLAKTPRQITGQDTDVDSRTTALRSNLDALLTKRADLASRYREGTAPTQTLDAQIATRQAELAKGRGDHTASGYHTAENPVYTDTTLQLTHAQVDLQAAQARAAKVASQIDGIVAQQKSMNSLELRFNVLEREQKQAADSYAAAAKILADRQIVEQVTSSKQAGVRILTAVVEPMLPAATRRLIVVLSVVLAIVVAALTVLLANYFRRGFLMAGAFERDCGIPVLVVIPDRKALGGGRPGAVRPV